MPGLYAAGDLTPGTQLVQVAAAKGAVAGVSAAQSLRGEPGAPRRAAPAPDPVTEIYGDDDSIDGGSLGDPSAEDSQRASGTALAP